MRLYVVDIFYYRMAKRIQRLFRGQFCRANMFQQRIIDIHYASSLNNYDRLKHYIDKYPELIVQLNSEGNTALHNAAKTASKRTLKLLLRFKMNPNALNVSGYSALHLCIMSPAVNRG
jgi:ankyrin repeat protein